MLRTACTVLVGILLIMLTGMVITFILKLPKAQMVVMSTKHFGLRLIQDQKQKTFFVAVLTDTQTLTSSALLSTWITHYRSLKK